MEGLCAPAIIYLLFSLTQILIDTYKGLYNTALIKILVTSIITFLLNILCQNELGIVSWIIVFIPFILMTVIVTLLLYVFGLKTSTGNINNTSNVNDISNNSLKNITTDSSGNIIIFDPYYNQMNNPIKFVYPNLIVSNPNIYNNPQMFQPQSLTQPQNISQTPNLLNFNSSSPAYQS